MRAADRPIWQPAHEDTPRANLRVQASYLQYLELYMKIFINFHTYLDPIFLNEYKRVERRERTS